MKTKYLIIICIFSCRFIHLSGQCLDANWQIIGPTGALPEAPNNGIGRLQAAAVHPTDINYIFTRSETGGLWTWYEDLGINTLMGTDQLDKIGVAAIAINPDNLNEILISTGRNNAPFQSTGYNSSGIYKTTNAGIEWTKVLDWKDILNPDFPEEIILAAHAINGLNNSGLRNTSLNCVKFNSLPTAINPAPINAPTMECVVEMGIPIFVAKKTVVAAPNATAIAREGSFNASSGIEHLT